MAENLLGQKEALPPVNEWRDVISLPVVSSEKPWNLNELEDVIFRSVRAVTQQALQENDGSIFTTLSGGVDSTLCLAIISEIVPVNTQIHTFTAGGSVNHPDIQYARVASRLYNTTHHEIIINDTAKATTINEFLAVFGDSPQTRQRIEQGDINVWAVYREIAKFNTNSVIAHDGIDELMGGYWPHCNSVEDKAKQIEVFEDFWHRLEPEQLSVLEATATKNGLKLLLPYLQKDVVKYISHIPIP